MLTGINPFLSHLNIHSHKVWPTVEDWQPGAATPCFVIGQTCDSIPCSTNQRLRFKCRCVVGIYRKIPSNIVNTVCFDAHSLILLLLPPKMTWKNSTVWN